MRTPRVLFLAASQAINPAEENAAWLQELAQPYVAFRDFTDQIVLSTPNGIPIIHAADTDHPGLTGAPDSYRDASLSWIASAVPIAGLRVADFDLLYIAGSRNSMTEMGHCRPLTALVEAFVRDKKPVAAIGLAVTALMALFDTDGAPYVKGRRLTAFTNREVVLHGLQAAMPYSLESRLIDYGAVYRRSADRVSNVVVDRLLVTGQNAESSVMAVLALRALVMNELSSA